MPSAQQSIPAANNIARISENVHVTEKVLAPKNCHVNSKKFSSVVMVSVQEEVLRLEFAQRSQGTTRYLRM